jgi:hypothetical protein
MLAFRHRLRRLTALTEVCQPAVFATVGSSASFVPDFGYAPFMRGLRPPFTAFEAAGLEFIPANGGGAGVRVRHRDQG